MSVISEMTRERWIMSTFPESYDPEVSPPSAKWLKLDEQKRILLVQAYHTRQDIELPNPQLHAVMHVITENQAAEDVCAVRETLLRLQAEGLSRHDAIHAVASVLSTVMFDVMKTKKQPDNEQYEADLKRLTAAGWLENLAEE